MKKEGMGRDENREKIKSARGIVTERYVSEKRVLDNGKLNNVSNLRHDA